MEVNSELRQNALARTDAMVSAPLSEAPGMEGVLKQWRGPAARDSPFVLDGPAVTLALIGGKRLLREASASLLTAQDGLHVLGTFESPAHFLAAGLRKPPAVILFDCDDSGPAALREALTALGPPRVDARIVMLCRGIREDVVACAIEHRVSGVILKSCSTKDMLAAIAYVVTGRTVMPLGWQRAASAIRRGPPGLSPRHREILGLIAQGRRNNAIAAELELSPNTIKFHIRALYSRLGVRNRVEAANRYAQMTSEGD